MGTGVNGGSGDGERDNGESLVWVQLERVRSAQEANRSTRKHM